MVLDAAMAETHMAPIHPETREVWGEKQWELVELATAWRYESDDDLRKEAEAEYKKAAEGIAFEERPLFKQSSFLLGAAYKDLPPPRKMYHCHPKTWEKLPKKTKAKFELYVNAESLSLPNSFIIRRAYQTGPICVVGLRPLGNPGSSSKSKK